MPRKTVQMIEVQGNSYPISSAAAIQSLNGTARLTILTAQPHSVTWLEKKAHPKLKRKQKSQKREILQHRTRSSGLDNRALNPTRRRRRAR